MSAEIRCSNGRVTMRRHGFTVIEMLVSIAIATLLLALLLPAIQGAQESARRMKCQNNLRQIGVAVANFEATNGFYPSNGWGLLWVGDPDRGVGHAQPGGWIYQLLPHVEQGAFARIGQGLSPAAKSVALAEAARTPIGLFKCPTRAASSVSPVNASLVFRNMVAPQNVAKTDYAINEGDFITNTTDGPDSIAQGDDSTYAWTDVSKATGVSFLRSEVRVAEVTDGTSSTYLVGEKNVCRDYYGSSDDDGYDAPLISGVDWDINRWTLSTPLPDSAAPQVERFGSAHVPGCYFVFCDGSVRLISYVIDRSTHRRLGNRKDGSPVEF